MAKMLRIAAHEFIKHLQRTSFLLTTLLIPLLGTALVFGIGLLGGKQPASPGLLPGTAEFQGTIGYVDSSGLIAQIPPQFPATLFRAYPSEATARAAVLTGQLNVFYAVPSDYLQRGQVTRYARQFQSSMGDVQLFRALLEANLLGGDMRTVALLDQPFTSTNVRIDQNGAVVNQTNDTDAGRNPLAFIVPYVFAMLLYMTVFFAASLLLQSVTEEKENRTIEILLTSLQPWQLLGGKVLGLGLLGLLQMLLWLGTSRFLLGASTGILQLFKQEFSLPWSTWALAVAYFLFGYLIYASLMAGIGATVTNMREGSQLTMLMVIPFIIPLWFLSVIIDQPNGTLATILSIFPLTAPVTMMIRVPLTDVAPLQIGLSFLLLAASIGLCIWLAARLFRVSTLLSGKRLSGREIMRAIRAG